MSEINTQNVPWSKMSIEGFSGKELLNVSNGSFKIVKIEPGSLYPMHQHPDKTEFAYVLEGTLEATIDTQVYQGTPGMFYQFPVGTRHGLKNPGTVDTVVLIGAIKDEVLN